MNDATTWVSMAAAGMLVLACDQDPAETELASTGALTYAASAADAAAADAALVEEDAGGACSPLPCLLRPPPSPNGCSCLPVTPMDAGACLPLPCPSAAPWDPGLCACAGPQSNKAGGASPVRAQDINGWRGR